ncbi:MBL fold metallo-hydrolase [Wenzhouxiangella sp. XN24]|uniref:MBL fold metallo-hydrolase n=1 Tax=Wenzhouxiangella sp. XN24 TaxID=2713569 RepID=UPI0013EDAD64|nr:MBL fold metallo-hydrolase [Wenzhouxiangella sp. XN24]NGX17538.1 MBL fold metallo-hydrolase [Wenzhouxiangella sp. XN24]
MHKPSLIDFHAGITAIDTEYVRPGLDASHLVVQGERAAFVDTGTTHSVPLLLAALKEKNLAPEQVDYVFLTHVHLDHAGGAGALMAALPRATAVLHPRGARHMADPSRLVAGSKAVYGDAAFDALYGEIVPIPAERIRTVEDGEKLALADRELEFLHTEGHARHHYCIVDPAAEAIFTGDCFGISYRELDTADGPFIFPTTTPVQFDPEAAHATLHRLLSYAPRHAFLTHFSHVSAPAALAPQLHRDLDAYVDIARRCRAADDPEESIRLALREWTFARLDAHGFDPDPVLRDEILHMDLALNAQGLAYWLAHAADGAPA